MPFTPSTDPQRSSVLINNIETRIAINVIIAPDEYQAFFMRPTVGLFGVLARVNTVSAEKTYACTGLLKRHIRPPGDKRLRDANVTFVI